MPIGCNDDDMPWDREGDELETKYMYVCHAELNAILNSAHSDLRGSRVYVTLFPLQRVRQGHHSERHPGNHLSFG